MTNEFFTWAVLLTYAGATLATSLVTQLIKGVGFIDKIPTRLTSYVIALVVLIAATFFTGGLTHGRGEKQVAGPEKESEEHRTDGDKSCAVGSIRHERGS